MSVIKKSMSVSLLVCAISLLATATLTWYLSKKYFEGVLEKQKIFEKMKMSEEQSLPSWMTSLLTAVSVFTIQFLLTLKAYLNSQRLKYESIQARYPMFHRQRRET